MTVRPPRRADQRRPPLPSRSARLLLRLLPDGEQAVPLAAMPLPPGADPAPGLRSLRRLGLAISRPDGWLLTPKGALLRDRLLAIPSPG